MSNKKEQDLLIRKDKTKSKREGNTKPLEDFQPPELRWIIIWHSKTMQIHLCSIYWGVVLDAVSRDTVVKVNKNPYPQGAYILPGDRK